MLPAAGIEGSTAMQPVCLRYEYDFSEGRARALGKMRSHAPVMRILFEDLSMLFILHRIDWDWRYRAWARARPHSSSPPTASAGSSPLREDVVGGRRQKRQLATGEQTRLLRKSYSSTHAPRPRDWGGSTPRLAFVQPTCKPDGRRPLLQHPNRRYSRGNRVPRLAGS